MLLFLSDSNDSFETNLKILKAGYINLKGLYMAIKI